MKKYYIIGCVVNIIICIVSYCNNPEDAGWITAICGWGFGLVQSIDFKHMQKTE